MGLFTDQLTDQQLLPPMRPALAQMHKIAAGLLFATAPKRTVAFRASYPISQPGH